MRMLKACGNLNFAFEPLDIDVCDELGREELDDDMPSKRCLHGNKYPRHSAAPEFAFQGVGSAERSLKPVAKIVEDQETPGSGECRVGGLETYDSAALR